MLRQAQHEVGCLASAKILILSLSKDEGAERSISMAAYVYIVRCRDGHYYVGSTRGGLEQRIAEHNDGTYGGYTKSRRPVRLMFSQEFERVADAVAAERQIKGWSRAKKEALIRGDMAALRRLAQNRIEYPHPSISSG
jgi:predicted GIY-YIG superfamily endonuclease